jgi:hypothetical protein
MGGMLLAQLGEVKRSEARAEEGARECRKIHANGRKAEGGRLKPEIGPVAEF